MTIENYGQDGTPHLTYYEPATRLSFVFDGEHGIGKVAVSYGGYGEAVLDVLFVDMSGIDRLDEHFARFKHACQAYALGWVTADATREARR